MAADQLIIPVLTGTAVVAIGGSLLLTRLARRAPLQARLEEIGGTRMRPGTPPPLPTGGGGRFTGVVQNIGDTVSNRKSSVSLREALTQAGYHQSGAAAVYLGAKVLLMVLGLAGACLLIVPTSIGQQSKLLIIGMITAAMFMLPNIVVSIKRGNRRKLIRRHLPDAIDLLEICCSAGMGLDQAWNSVADEVRTVCPTLADEMALTNLEIHLGAPRTDAMRHMAKRTGAEELSSLVAMLLQAERFGSSISEGLQSYAAFMRETRSQRAQEAAEKMAIKLIFPMVIAIFPAVVLLMAGPAFISLFRATRQ